MLDEVMPRYDVNEVHDVEIDADPERVMAAVREVTPLEVPLLVGLMALRSPPKALGVRPGLRSPLLGALTAGGFVELDDDERGLALGVVGRFWSFTGGLRPMSAGRFREFDDPGWAKGAIAFEVRPGGGRTLLRTETRVVTTSADARRRFGRYWRAVGPFSGLIRIAWLRAVRRRAERG